MIFRTVVFLCVLMMLSAFAYAGNLAMQNAFLTPDGRVTSHLDNPEPDTLTYLADDPTYVFSTLANFWYYQKFTPPADFELRSVYVALQNAGASATCSLFVCLLNGTNPGTVLSSTTFQVDAGGWSDVTLPDTVSLAANQNFMILVGRATGPTGWTPLLSQTNPAGRSYYTNPNGNRTGPYNLQNGINFGLEAGGSIATYVDLRADQCYDSVAATGRGYFFIAPDSVVYMRALVKNLSTVAYSNYGVTFSVLDPNGTSILEDSVAGINLQPNASGTIRSALSFPAATEGEYRATVIVHAVDDAVADNDTTWLRFFVGSYPYWFRYDDNADASDGSTFLGEGHHTAIGFRPSIYPARVDTVRVYASDDDASARVRIFRNNNTTGKPTGTAVWTSAAGLIVQGWNSIPVTPPVQIVGTGTNQQSFSVAYVFGPSSGLGLDSNVPNDDRITKMDTLVWQSTDGTTWSGDVVGNWMVQAHVRADTISAVGDLPTSLPHSYSLAQNYPNPFNPTTDIQFSLPIQSQVRLTVYDILGQEVATLVNGSLTAGEHTVAFNAASLPSGIYFYRLEAGSFSDIRKMMLLK
jgi:hypothetical protein